MVHCPISQHFSLPPRDEHALTNLQVQGPQMSCAQELLERFALRTWCNKSIALFWVSSFLPQRSIQGTDLEHVCKQHAGFPPCPIYSRSAKAVPGSAKRFV